MVFLVENLGWRPTFVVCGVLTWCICIPLGLVFRSKPQHYGQLPDGDLPEEVSNASSPSPGGAPKSSGNTEENVSVGRALKTPAFWILSLIFGAQTMGVSGLNVHLLPYFQTIGFSAGEAASVLAVYTVLSVFGRLGGGWAMDFFDRRMVTGIASGVSGGWPRNPCQYQCLLANSAVCPALWHRLWRYDARTKYVD